MNRHLSRKVKGSNNWHKQLKKVRAIYYKMTNIRNDFWHKAVSKICNDNQIICIEDLNIKGMCKNIKWSFTLADIGLGEFRRQLDYKKSIRELTFVDNLPLFNNYVVE